MENSTDSANRTAATPYGRAYPPGLWPSAPSPTAPACAFGGATPPGFPRLRLPLSCLAYRPGLAYQGRGKPRRWPTPPPAHSSSTAAARQPRKSRFSRKSGLPRPCPTSPPARAGRPQVERQEKGLATRPPSWPASLHPTMTAGKRGSRIVISSEAGPDVPRPPRSVQKARNRARPGGGAAAP